MDRFLKWLRKDYPQLPETQFIPRKLQPRPAVTKDHFDQLWAIDRAISEKNAVLRISTRNNTHSDGYRTFGTYVVDSPEYQIDVGQTELSADGLQYTSRRIMNRTRRATEPEIKQVQPVTGSKSARKIVARTPIELMSFLPNVPDNC